MLRIVVCASQSSFDYFLERNKHAACEQCVQSKVCRSGAQSAILSDTDAAAHHACACIMVVLSRVLTLLAPPGSENVILTALRWLWRIKP